MKKILIDLIDYLKKALLMLILISIADVVISVKISPNLLLYS